MKTLKIDHHIKADVLIIGGGFSGLWAAISAREHVENVVLVDKGPADWGGLGTSSGGDFQCVQDTTVEAALDDVVYYHDGLCDQELVENILTQSYQRFEHYERLGVRFERDENGKLKAIPQRNLKHMKMLLIRPYGIGGPSMRDALVSEANRLGVRRLSRISISDIILDDLGEAAGAVGFCGAGRTLKAARAALHFWEEPCISGTRGSGTVFFSGCTLKCCFCQNYPISAEGLGKEISVEHLAEIFLSLQAQGAHNINLVTPGQWRPWIIAALDLARAQGLHLPIVCNTGGYETVENVEAWRGYIDIWLADLKYVSPALSAELSAAPDYFAQAKPAIEAMMAQAGHPVFDADGILQRGVILRHLALPGHVDDSFAVLDQMAAWNDADPGCFLPSVMSQYTPFYKAAEHGIGRRITTYEYHRVVNYAMDKGLVQGYMQQKSSAKEEYTPSFDLTGV